MAQPLMTTSFLIGYWYEDGSEVVVLETDQLLIPFIIRTTMPGVDLSVDTEITLTPTHSDVTVGDIARGVARYRAALLNCDREVFREVKDAARVKLIREAWMESARQKLAQYRDEALLSYFRLH